ncbi:hypothetical protein [Algisphaera agarilytica]|uniref:NAD/NADP transhydrogenase alpha subunit n=1 Tax=Algisphaera agarilytica TaxID=1385975 RepID=A0A7X0H7Z7_9BACT|nr:hypothetical protein [Algisphaera agarilytica]MBB6430943.1 NAD/NADP transhydrogenase alpha subunit [Algisphaera agarilytica]
MKVRNPAWFRSAIVSNFLAFACFAASTMLNANLASKAIVLGLGFAVAGLYMFAVSCKDSKKKKE